MRALSPALKSFPGVRRAVLTTGLAAIVALPLDARAQAPWQPPAGVAQLPIWPGTPPDARPSAKPESSVVPVDSVGRPRLIGGKPTTFALDVSVPTMTVFRAAGRNTGIAIVVFPGGGYNALAMDLSGTEMCDWLVPRGITCVVLKYRVPCAVTGRYRDCRTALQDAQRAVGLLRHRAAEWGIDPRRIGVLGFSAGGHMVVALSTHHARRAYPAVDAADRTSCRPDFAVALYPGHIVTHAIRDRMNPDIRVTREAPPTLLVQAQDDPVDPVENSLLYYAALQRAGVSAELHVYPTGGHAFGLRRTTAAITAWPDLLEPWLRTIGVLREIR